MDANARATDRAIMNSSSPSKMAGLIASGYNSQLADGELYRKALEYNDAQKKAVEEFNRGTNQYNSQAYQQNSQFNADARNRARQYGASMALNAAAQRMNADAAWNQGIYGNISGLFKGISDLGRENAQNNMVNWLLSKGWAGSLPDPDKDKYIAQHVQKAKKSQGGKLGKNKRRGLTF